MVSGFKQFLDSVQMHNQLLAHLSRHITIAETLISEYSTASKEQSHSIAAHLSTLSTEFYQKAEEIKNSLESFTQQDPDILLNPKKAMHIQALFKTLSSKINMFSRVKQIFSSLVREREFKEEEIAFNNSSFSTAPPHTNTNNQQSALHFQYRSSPATEYINNQNQSLKDLLSNLSDLESLSIELNSIIETSTDNIDRISIKTAQSNTTAISTNRALEAGITRRRRIKKLKKLFIFLLAILLTLAIVFLGTRIFQFIITMKKALFK